MLKEKVPAFQFSLGVVERFWRKVSVDTPDACWEWTAAIDKEGYGQFWDGNHQVRAHRYSYAYALPGRSIGDSLGELSQQVLHRCDNPRCVNPRHLFAGTQRDNMQDRKQKGRANTPAGERHWNAKLTQGDVDRIRELVASGSSQSSVARSFRLGVATVCRIVHGVVRQGLR